MKLLEFKEAVFDRLGFLKAITIFSFQKETAYWSNNWTSVLSTTIYTLSMLLFLDVIYSNVNVVAGYSRNEMLVFFLLVQVTFFTNWGLWQQNLRDFIVSVNRGDLDLLLVRPVPVLFFITFRRIKLLSLLRDAVPPMVAIILSIKWDLVTFTVPNLLAAAALFVMGMIAVHVFQFLATLPVFWFAESKSVLKISMAVESGTKLTPLEGFTNNPLRLILGTVAPTLISAGFATSVLLGKSDPIYMLLWAFIVTVVALYIRDIAWQIALRSYTSASS